MVDLLLSRGADVEAKNNVRIKIMILFKCVSCIKKKQCYCCLHVSAFY